MKTPHTAFMLVRALLFALILISHNACGSACPQIECDDLINLVFSASQSGDYSVTFAGQEHFCVGGEPQSIGLAACGPSGALLRSAATELTVTVQGDGWSANEEIVVARVRPTNREQPDCEIPCTRGEVSVEIR